MDYHSDSPPGCCDAIRTLRGRERCSLNRILKCIDVIALLIVLVVQGSTLNFFLISRMEGSGNGWYFWFLADFAVLLITMSAVFVARRQQNHRLLVIGSIQGTTSENVTLTRVLSQQPCLQQQNSVLAAGTNGSACQRWMGNFPLSYISWLIYSGLLASKVVLLIQMDIAVNIPNEAWYGSQFLTLVIGCAALVFALLVDAHAPADSQQQTFIVFVTAYASAEILDAVTLLSLLFPGSCDRSSELGLDDIILGLTCANFLLPTLSIYKLAQCQFGAETRPIGIKLLHRLLDLVAINGPYLVIRMYLWTQFNTDVSVFLLKNVIFCYAHIRSFVPKSREWVSHLRAVREGLLNHNHHRSFDETKDKRTIA
ncbi:uncharacterized protein LOC111262504 isoform X1 [Varroa jacobsoni]|uniref:uncharacterized protein LOC111262504 isoform X1 n=1 Tax=Varroa jacobsoni TaxID=62625 RepID=UPI000BF65B4C|nr:uncharacterized protein LOC111262504 isoform X1 [Varroa jacobsoni]